MTHPWCTDIERDLAVRAAEDAVPRPALPEWSELPKRMAALEERVALLIRDAELESSAKVGETPNGDAGSKQPQGGEPVAWGEHVEETRVGVPKNCITVTCWTCLGIPEISGACPCCVNGQVVKCLEGGSDHKYHTVVPDIFSRCREPDYESRLERTLKAVLEHNKTQVKK